jgi:hypothetical protein
MDYPWRNRFLDIAEKAIIELNLEYCAMSIGQSGIKFKNNSISDPTIHGFELADERTVCSKILIEALRSPLFSGAIEIENGKITPRYYKLNREERGYPSPNNRKKVDIVIQRFNIENIEDKGGNYKPVYIEAKRAKLYSIKNLSKGEVLIGEYQYDDVCKDITEKLCKVKKDIYKYVLVWGILSLVEEKDKRNTPASFYDTIKKTVPLKSIELRWIPVAWNKSDGKKPPEVCRWIWIALMEVN